MRTSILAGLLVLLLSVFSVQLEQELTERAQAANLAAYETESEDFRRMELNVTALQALMDMEGKGYSRGRLLAVLLPYYHYQLPPKVSWTLPVFQKAYGLFLEHRGTILLEAVAGMSAVWDDVEQFPVEAAVSYENSWMARRTYGGERGHEGTDLMPPENYREFYPILSMTDGVVEQVGWLPKGGYRIGIRSPSGGYFYYAHLSSYARKFQEGEPVFAGETLGFMGDTGYGEEGTYGKFDVHLHLGIYIKTARREEVSVNPYWVLRYLQEGGEKEKG